MRCAQFKVYLINVESASLPASFIDLYQLHTSQIVFLTLF